MTEDNENLRPELRELVAFVRSEVERDLKAGRDSLDDPALSAWLEAQAGRESRRPAERRVSEIPMSTRLRKNEETAPSRRRVNESRASTGVRIDKTSEGSQAEAASSSKALPAAGVPRNDARDLDVLRRDLEALGREAAVCTKCGLCESRTQVVYGSGSARQPLMFVGEAPGYHEDQQGLPFVGPAGKLLTDIITAMGFERRDVYIANVLKCRPPENRDPLPHEIEACRPWLERQIEIVRPRVICTLGKHSAQLLTRSKASIGAVRGKVHDYKGIPVVPTYHPAFLLRSPGYKRATWEDVQLVRELYLAAEAGD
jgi:DNA polymerase